MSPWGYHYRVFGGPSRFVWFVLGGATATWWAKHNEIHRAIANSEGEGHRSRCSSSSKYDHHHRQTGQAQYAVPPPSAPPALPRQQEQPAPQMPIPWWGSERTRQDEKDNNSMSDLYETTLETVLNTVDMLKAVRLQHECDWVKG
ncbi:hypothetical protein FIBSPDRAFT_853565 [Athelia psychrophila]|uniref:Uncharacterized protein n=1 Tax=Athelia psychrophila TaxID=1759441 RepID=A0A166QMM4_9AGAM|nr:hypothetical protein FIBSPDRAFT_853565 [Fibularhizoctonia sp. CBS 109695]